MSYALAQWSAQGAQLTLSLFSAVEEAGYGKKNFYRAHSRVHYAAAYVQYYPHAHMAYRKIFASLQEALFPEKVVLCYVVHLPCFLSPMQYKGPTATYFGFHNLDW